MSNLNLNTDDDLNLSELYGGRKEEAPWYRRFGSGLMSRLGISILASLIVGTMMNLPYIKLVVLWSCSIILAIFGNPEGPTPVREKLSGLVGQVDTAAPAIPSPGEDPPPEAPIGRFRQAAEKAEGQAKEKIVQSAVAPIRDAAGEKVQEVKEQVAETGQAVKDGAEKIATSLNPIRLPTVTLPGISAGGRPTAEPLSPEELKQLEIEQTRQTVLARRRARDRRAAQNSAIVNAGMNQVIGMGVQQGQANQQAQQQAIQRFMSGGRP